MNTITSQNEWDAYEDGVRMLDMLDRSLIDNVLLIRCLCEIVEHVLPIYERNTDNRDPHKFLELLRQWIETPTDKTRWDIIRYHMNYLKLEFVKNANIDNIVSLMIGVINDLVPSLYECNPYYSRVADFCLSVASYEIYKNLHAYKSRWSEIYDFEKCEMLVSLAERKWQADCVRKYFPIIPQTF
ncbi:MAG: hypothetical protein LBP87_00840 [Planctomycetaceae bacterium]|jgi:hypothetical protein|nr:hypothetical protein [Planctomycetaceae bacterium]